jgi:phosphoglycolate phosphatase
MLRADGYRLLICTSKPEPYARKVLDHLQLRSLVDEVYGAELDGRLDDKGDLIQHILEKERFAASEATMVGDRMHDINGAKRHSMQSVGVLWGFGNEEELVNAGASVLCARPLDLSDCIRKLV